MGSGRSVLAVYGLEANVVDVAEAVGEAVEDDFQCACAVFGEDVAQMAARVIGENDEGEEAPQPFGAFERVVGEVDVIVFDDAFVGSNHDEMF